MIQPEAGLAALESVGIRFLTGVPDSLLRSFCDAVVEALPPERHLLAANEGAAVGAAIGHYLATGTPALVYLQNSGLGNAVNPLASLASPRVYGIPMVLMVGWRGETPGDGMSMADEPQHRLQGEVTLAQLDLLGIPLRVMGPESDPVELFRWAVEEASSEGGPAALVVRAGTFARPPTPSAGSDALSVGVMDPGALSREAAISAILEALPEGLPIVGTTGMASRELFELRRHRGDSHDLDFLTVGGMGHALSVAGGIARSRPGPVVCLDGDGALLMHLGALTDTAALPNLIHIVLNNGAHDSVGGQPTAAGRLPLSGLARAAGHQHVLEAGSAEGIASSLGLLLRDGHGFLEIRCRRGSRSDLGRPDIPLHDARDLFIRRLRGG